MARTDRERAETAERRCGELEQQLAREIARKHSAQQALWYALEALKAPDDMKKRLAALDAANEVIS